MHKTNLKYISIHALCEEGDLTRTALLLFLWIFLSTPSARRATLAGRFTSSTVLISIHALCEEGDQRPGLGVHLIAISIHALCEEGDGVRYELPRVSGAISIHALCEEGDTSCWSCWMMP